MTTSGTETPSDTAGSNALKVLFVDDSATIRQSAQLVLEQAGYSVMLAEDGFQALSQVVQWHPDVVLADIAMPRLDGYQLCALIKSNADYQGIPVIMLSGKDGQFDEERACLVGSDNHVAKPFSAQALTAALDSFISQDQPENAG